MGVYVEGLPMPKNCSDCPFYYHGFCEALDDRIASVWDQEDYLGRHEECPLTEVKTPHGRLIDSEPLCRAAEQRKGIVNIDHIYAAPAIIEKEI